MDDGVLLSKEKHIFKVNCIYNLFTGDYTNKTSCLSSRPLPLADVSGIHRSAKEVISLKLKTYQFMPMGLNGPSTCLPQEDIPLQYMLI